MRKAAIILFILALATLGGVSVLRFLGLAAPQSASATPPGEGLLDQPGDNFTGLYRSWSLGGRETSTTAQEEAILRLGTARGSRLVGMELRRRELERQILQAQTRLKEVQAAATAARVAEKEAAAMETEIFEDSSDGIYDEEQDGEEDFETGFETEGEDDLGAEYDADEPEWTDEEIEALQSLTQLQEERDKLLAELTPEKLAREKDRLAEIALIAGGASRGMQTLLARWGQPFSILPVDAVDVGDKPVVILPSGAMDKKMGGPLAAYVRRGGTLIAMAQRNAALISALPGRPRGYGWEEVESAFENAVEVAAVHPSTVSCQKPRFSAAVDGLFTELPKGAEVLLRGTQTGQPVAAVYPFGRGLVVVTSLFTDWEALSRNPGDGENRFLRDLILWAVARNKRFHPEILAPGARVRVTVPVHNRQNAMAIRVRMAYLTPEGVLCPPFDLDRRVLAGETDTNPITIRTPSTPGVWRLVYALLKADGSYLQY
ncbi:MAG: hypothetical protein K6U03_03755, partial [Firmicutes bacterium]|nr:hypothetical protein [Bacillota bacterium]